MDDDSLKNIFQNFNPPMPSEEQFMADLERSISAVESVKEQCALARRRTHRALLVAACVGFVAGALLTLLFAQLEHFVFSQIALIQAAEVARFVADNSQMIVWCMMGAAIVGVSLSAYSVALAVTARVKPQDAISPLD